MALVFRDDTSHFLTPLRAEWELGLTLENAHHNPAVVVPCAKVADENLTGAGRSTPQVGAGDRESKIRQR